MATTALTLHPLEVIHGKIRQIAKLKLPPIFPLYGSSRPVCLSVCLSVISEPAHLDVIALRLQHG